MPIPIAIVTAGVAGLVAIFQALPAIIQLIQNLDLPEADKETYIKRIKDAQASLPVWE